MYKIGNKKLSTCFPLCGTFPILPFIASTDTQL